MTSNPSGWTPCTATSAPPPGTRIWTRRATERHVWGDGVKQQYGVQGGILLAADELTVRKAGKEHACSACHHLIAPGALHGVLVTSHYCACCITATPPEAEFRHGSAAA